MLSLRPVKPERSQWLIGYILISHVFFIIAFLCSYAPWWVITLGIIFSFISLFYRWKRDIERSLKYSVVSAIPPASGSSISSLSDLKQPLVWQLVLGHGQKIDAVLQGSTRVLSWLVVLHFRKGLRSFFLPVFPDALPEQQFRRLKVFLRINCKKAFSKKAAQ